MHNSPKNLMKLIATDTQTLLVFEATSLKWAAQLPFTPIIMKRANFMVNICNIIFSVVSNTGIIKVSQKIAFLRSEIWKT